MAFFCGRTGRLTAQKRWFPGPGRGLLADASAGADASLLSHWGLLAPLAPAEKAALRRRERFGYPWASKSLSRRLVYFISDSPYRIY
jgi:hypothetical protein